MQTMITGPATRSKPHWNQLVASRLAEYPLYIQRTTPRHSPVSRLQLQPGIEMHVTHRGRGAFCLNDELHVQEGRQIVLLSGDAPHQVFADTTSGYERSVLCFDQSILNWVTSDGRLGELGTGLPTPASGYELSLSAQDWPEVEHHLERLTYEFTRRGRGWEASMLGALLQLLVAVLRHGEETPAEEPDSLPRRCVELVNNHLDQDLSLTLLADMLRISPKHLSRTFSAAVGMTLSGYILHQRVGLAKRLLREHEHLSISGVASRCGFKSTAHFSSSFAQRTGMTPTAFRSAVMSSAPRRDLYENQDAD